MRIGNAGEHPNSIDVVFQLISLHELATQRDHAGPLAGAVIFLVRATANLACVCAVGQSLKNLCGQVGTGLDVLATEPRAEISDGGNAVAAATGVRTLPFPDRLSCLSGT